VKFYGGICDGGFFRHDAIFLDLLKADLSGANLTEADLSGANLSQANLSGAKLARTNLYKADLSEATLSGADLSGAKLPKADLEAADLAGWTPKRTSVERASVSRTLAGRYKADLSKATLSGADLSGAKLPKADLEAADLSRTNLAGANLEGAALVETDLTDADLTGCHIYGISAWGLKLSSGTKQHGLVIAQDVTVDDIEVAQFLYVLLSNEKLQRVIDTITTKVVLILGRFSLLERKRVLDALRDELRRRGYVPVVFDFEKPRSQTTINTVTLLARMARFVIADVSDAKSVLQELQAIVPSSPTADLDERVIGPAEAKAAQLRA
jgi:uncharacterized protein YjbI with pentapeptide repeats